MDSKYNNLKLNLHKSPDDRRDYHVKVSTTQPLKSGMIDLSNYCTSIKSQGYVGSCTACATIALMEYIHKKSTGDINNNDIYSERFTYYTTRVDQLGWSASDDSGAYLRNAVASVVQQGAASESKFPYYSSSGIIDISEKPSSEVYASAETNQVVSYARIDDGKLSGEELLQECLYLLYSGYPFVGGFVCYDSLFNPSVWDTGILEPPGGSVIGGHAVLFVGYNTDTKLLKFKNSWGEEWGDNGYGYLPFDYLLKGDLWDLWSIFKQENFSNSDFLHIDKPTEETKDIEDSKDVIDDGKFRKEWGNVIKTIQDINTENKSHDTRLGDVVKNLINAISDLDAELKLYQNNVNDKLKSLQTSIINMNDLIK